MRHAACWIVISFLILWVAGCGRDGPADSDRTVAWRLEITSQAMFGVRIWLDGEAVYAQPTAGAQQHQVDVERPYRSGQHLVEFEILSASSNPSTYTAAWTVQVKPNGTSFTADGVPTVLSAGQRLTVRVAL